MGTLLVTIIVLVVLAATLFSSVVVRGIRSYKRRRRMDTLRSLESKLHQASEFYYGQRPEPDWLAVEVSLLVEELERRADLVKVHGRQRTLPCASSAFLSFLREL